MTIYDPTYYFLDGKTPVGIKPSELYDRLGEWAEWFKSADRTVVREQIGGYLVSTVFLGLDHNFDPDRGPVLFETMVFEGDDALDLLMQRYSTWEEAEAGHRAIAELVRLKTLKTPENQESEC